MDGALPCQAIEFWSDKSRMGMATLDLLDQSKLSKRSANTDPARIQQLQNSDFYGSIFHVAPRCYLPLSVPTKCERLLNQTSFLRCPCLDLICPTKMEDIRGVSHLTLLILSSGMQTKFHHFNAQYLLHPASHVKHTSSMICLER